VKGSVLRNVGACAPAFVGKGHVPREVAYVPLKSVWLPSGSIGMQSLSGAGYRQACAASTSGRKAAPSSIGWQVSRHGAAAAARTGGSDSSSCSNSIHARCNVINPGGSPRFSGSSRNFSAEGVRLVFPERKNALREAVMQYYDEVRDAAVAGQAWLVERCIHLVHLHGLPQPGLCAAACTATGS
jgi:hypothetical protein